MVNLVATALLLPQLEVNATLMLSPVAAAALLVYIIFIILEPKDPESNVPVEPTAPIGIDQA